MHACMHDKFDDTQPEQHYCSIPCWYHRCNINGSINLTEGKQLSLGSQPIGSAVCVVMALLQPQVRSMMHYLACSAKVAISTSGSPDAERTLWLASQPREDCQAQSSLSIANVSCSSVPVYIALKSYGWLGNVGGQPDQDRKVDGHNRMKHRDKGMNLTFEGSSRLAWIHEGGGGTSARTPLAREAAAQASWSRVHR